MAAGVGFLMHDELSHLLVWPCKTRGQGMFKKTGGSLIWKQEKSSAVISFHRRRSFYSPESSAGAKSGRSPARTWGQSRWQSLSWHPGEATFCQHESSRLLGTTPKLGIIPSGEKELKGSSTDHDMPCHPRSKNPHQRWVFVCHMSKQMAKPIKTASRQSAPMASVQTCLAHSKIWWHFLIRWVGWLETRWKRALHRAPLVWLQCRAGMVQFSPRLSWAYTDAGGNRCTKSTSFLLNFILYCQDN